MENVRLLIILIISSLFSFLLYNAWIIFSNLESIIEFNKKYNSFIFISNNNITFTDTTVIDPNDDAVTSQEKWRCVLYNNKYIQISQEGITSVSAKSIDLEYVSLTECILDVFSNRSKIVYDPCVVVTSTDCIFLKATL